MESLCFSKCLDAEDNLKNCEINQFKSCNGYAMWQYQQDQNSPKMYFRNGGLPAATSLAMVTENQEVIVWTVMEQHLITLK